MYISFCIAEQKRTAHFSIYLCVRTHTLTPPAYTHLPNTSGDMHSNAFAVSNHKMTDKRQHASTCRIYTAHKRTYTVGYAERKRERKTESAQNPNTSHEKSLYFHTMDTMSLDTQ